MQHWYLMTSTILFLLLVLVWNNKDWLNIFFKILLFMLTVVGILLILQHYDILYIYDNQ